MSKDKITEINMISRFIGDFFDGLQSGTADRLLRKAKERGLPIDVQKQMKKIKKDSDDLEQLIRKYQKNTK